MNQYSSPRKITRLRRLRLVSDNSDANWRILTESANAAYKRAEYDTAAELYKQALGESERLMDVALRHGCPETAPVAYNISCHNIAAYMEHHEVQETAGNFYRIAFERLRAGARSEMAPLGIRLACARHLKPALLAYATHLEGIGASQDEIDALVLDARMTALRVFEIASHAERQATDCPHCLPGGNGEKPDRLH